MKVSVITVPLMGECICFKTKTLFESIYAVRNPYKAHKLPNYEDVRAIDVYKDRLGKRITMSDNQIKTLKKMKVQIIDENTTSINDNWKHIYKNGASWFAIVALHPPPQSLTVGSRAHVTSKPVPLSPKIEPKKQKNITQTGKKQTKIVEPDLKKKSQALAETAKPKKIKEAETAAKPKPKKIKEAETAAKPKPKKIKEAETAKPKPKKIKEAETAKPKLKKLIKEAETAKAKKTVDTKNKLKRAIQIRPKDTKSISKIKVKQRGGNNEPLFIPCSNFEFFPKNSQFMEHKERMKKEFIDIDIDYFFPSSSHDTFTQQQLQNAIAIAKAEQRYLKRRKVGPHIAIAKAEQRYLKRRKVGPHTSAAVAGVAAAVGVGGDSGTGLNTRGGGRGGGGVVAAEAVTSGGYYHSEFRKCEADHVMLDTKCELDDIFHSILAFSDSCHDFSDIPKSTIFDIYYKNQKYNKDLESLKIKTGEIQKKWKEKVIFNETELNTIYLAQLNKLVNNYFDKYIDAKLYNTYPKQSSPAEINHEPVGKNGPSTWEAPFLSKFYYSLFPVTERENIYKVNINLKEGGWAEKLSEFLIENKFRYYFFDMIIGQKAGLHGFTWGALKNTLDKSDIIVQNTIAKWWDPSAGGNIDWDEQDIEDLSAILKEDVFQTFQTTSSNIEFDSIVSVVHDADKIIKFDDADDILYDVKKTTSRFVKLSIITTERTDYIYIQIFKDVFTINNCKKLYQYIENIGTKPTNQLSPLHKIIKDNLDALKLVVLSLKRSGDHGQVMYLKHFNTIQKDKERAFIITGDSLCAVKAMYEKVPVLFFKYHNDIKENEAMVDIYLYNPNPSKRESYIITHKSIFENLIESGESEPKLENRKIKLTVETSNNLVVSIDDSIVKSDNDEIDIDMNKLKLYKLFKYFTEDINDILILQLIAADKKKLETALKNIVKDPEVFTAEEGRKRSRAENRDQTRRNISAISDRFEEVINNIEILSIYLKQLRDLIEKVNKDLEIENKNDLIIHLTDICDSTLKEIIVDVIAKKTLSPISNTRDTIVELLKTHNTTIMSFFDHNNRVNVKTTDTGFLFIQKLAITRRDKLTRDIETIKGEFNLIIKDDTTARGLINGATSE
jgi:hypothetical protein